jgi:translation initiation factor 5A
LFTNKKIDDIFSTSGTVWAPIVSKVEYEVADISEDGFVSLIEKDNSLKEDIKLPADAELSANLQKCWDENNNNCQIYFTVLSACGNSKIVSFRTK